MVLDDISYTATDRAGEAVTIDEAYVQKHVGAAGLASNARFCEASLPVGRSATAGVEQSYFMLTTLAFFNS